MNLEPNPSAVHGVFRRFPRRRPGRRLAFTLVELLVVAAIGVALAAVSMPLIRVMLRETRLSGATARLRAGLQQTRNILTDYPVADFSQTSPRVAGASYTGTAMVVRWDDVRKNYDVLYALCAQTARNPGLKGMVRPDVATALPLEANLRGYLATAGPTSTTDYAYRGYAMFTQLEPMALGEGIRVVGLRRRDGFGDASIDGQTRLEIISDGGVPVSSFAVCVDATGVCIPPARAIYVNLQTAPPDFAKRPADSPWNVWSTLMYDDKSANTGAYADTYVEPSPTAATAGQGEGFLTSLPVLLVYHDDDLPLIGDQSPGRPWRVPNARGVMVLNPALDPNDVLAQTKGRVVMLSLQGGSPLEN